MKKGLKILIIIIMCFIVNIKTTYAKSYIKDLFQSGENVKIDKPLEGTSFIAGNDVEVNSAINGIGFIAGAEININAKQEYLFAFSNELTLNNDIEKDLFAFSSEVNIDSNVKRDAYVAGEIVNINGTIDRNIYVYGTEVNLNGTFNGNVIVNGTMINIDENAKIIGQLKYNEDALVEGLNETLNTKTYKIAPTKVNFKEHVTNFITTFIHITLVAIVIVFVREKLLKDSLKQTEKPTAKKLMTLCGKGFLILIGLPIIAMMLMFSGVFISVGVIAGIIYGLIVYISSIFTAYFIANQLDKKCLKKNLNSYLLVIIGLFIIKVIEIIPIIGGIASFLSLIFGLGIVGNMIIESKK